MSRYSRLINERIFGGNSERLLFDNTNRRRVTTGNKIKS
jgi:hypothetical protein